MTNFVFLNLAEVLAIHDDQVRQHGGSLGIRDQGLLESAQAESTFGGQFVHEDVFAMAAAYAFHLASNHPFIDGNKRVALAVSATFLLLNGYEISADEEPLYEMMIGLASGQRDKDSIAAFFRANVVRAQ